MRAANRSLAENIDYRLLGSAIARVRWELDINPRWQCDPTFYIEQTAVALQDSLLPPPPIDVSRAETILNRAENIPSILEQARANLQPIAPFAQLAIITRSDIDSRLARVERGVAPLLSTDAQRNRLHPAITKATAALVDYRNWLKQRLPTLPTQFTLGANSYEFLLHRVALPPYTPQQLLDMARQDFNRVLSDEAYERQRDLDAPQLTLPASANEEIARMTHDEAATTTTSGKTETSPSPSSAGNSSASTTTSRGQTSSQNESYAPVLNF